MEFRYYCIDKNDHIIAAETVWLPSLAAAIALGHEKCKHHKKFPTDKVEIWQGTNLLYPEPRAAA